MIEEHSVKVGPFKVSLAKIYGAFYKLKFSNNEMDLAEIPISADLLYSFYKELESSMIWFTDFSYEFPVQNTICEHYTMMVGSGTDGPAESEADDDVYMEMYTSSSVLNKGSKIFGFWVNPEEVFNIRLLVESFLGGS